MMEQVNMGIKNCHPFEIDNSLKKMLLLTDAPTDKRLITEAKLPFPMTFLDITLTKEDLKDFGLDCEKIMGILLCEQRKKNEDGEEIRTFFISFAGVQSKTEKGENVFIEDVIVPANDFTIDNVKIAYHGNKNSLKFFRDLILNFCMFVNYPEVEIRVSHRSEKSRQRRIKKGFVPLPSSNKIILTGKLLKYLSVMESQFNSDCFDFKFWVRGHWRRYQSARYTEAKGKVLWIEPFMKGKGEVRPATYVLKSRETKRD